jgi:hypothetical protein
MNPLPLKSAAVGLLILLLVAIGATWKVQDWRFGSQLAEQAGLHKDDLTAISDAAVAQGRAQQEERLSLELRLSVSEQIPL